MSTRSIDAVVRATHLGARCRLMCADDRCR